MTFSATCPSCGTVYLPAEAVALFICTLKQASFYRFECPICDEWIILHAGPRTITDLIEGGVAPYVFSPPPELKERHQGKPFTLDDLIDLHFEIEALEAVLNE